MITILLTKEKIGELLITLNHLKTWYIQRLIRPWSLQETKIIKDTKV